jgi:phosphoribosylaminoimidazole-succinocarboxamide synthase
LLVMSDLYRSLSEAWMGERLWNAPSLGDATRTVTEVIGR